MVQQENYTLDQFPQFAAECFKYFNSIENRLSQKAPIPNVNDRCTLSEAVEITGLGKSKLYKLTATDDVPVKRYGKKLIFSRRELIEWVESKTVSGNNHGAAVLELAHSANKKRA